MAEINIDIVSETLVVDTGGPGIPGPEGPANSLDGDVVGPAGATDNTLVAFDTATGKLIKEAGSDAVAAAGALMDSELASLSGVKSLTIPDDTLITAFMKTLFDDTDADAAKTTLEITGGVGFATFEGDPTGATSNTSAFQSFLDTNVGDVLYVPKGEYLFSTGDIEIPSNTKCILAPDAKIVFAGGDGTKLFAITGSTDAIDYNCTAISFGDGYLMDVVGANATISEKDKVFIRSDDIFDPNALGGDDVKMGEIMIVTSVDGTRMRFSNPIQLDFATNIKVRKVVPKKNIGFSGGQFYGLGVPTESNFGAEAFPQGGSWIRTQLLLADCADDVTFENMQCYDFHAIFFSFVNCEDGLLRKVKGKHSVGAVGYFCYSGNASRNVWMDDCHAENVRHAYSQGSGSSVVSSGLGLVGITNSTGAIHSSCRGTNGQSDAFGTHAAALNVKFHDLDIEGASLSGVLARCASVEITNCRISGTTRNGIWLGRACTIDRDALISNNTIEQPTPMGTLLNLSAEADGVYKIGEYVTDGSGAFGLVRSYLPYSANPRLEIQETSGTWTTGTVTGSETGAIGTIASITPAETITELIHVEDRRQSIITSNLLRLEDINAIGLRITGDSYYNLANDNNIACPNGLLDSPVKIDGGAAYNKADGNMINCRSGSSTANAVDRDGVTSNEVSGNMYTGFAAEV